MEGKRRDGAGGPTTLLTRFAEELRRVLGRKGLRDEGVKEEGWKVKGGRWKRGLKVKNRGLKWGHERGRDSEGVAQVVGP